MLYFRQGFRGGNHSPQTFIVELVGGSAGGPPSKDGAHRDDMIFVRYILMNGVVGETREREIRAGEKNFNFVGGGEFLDAIEDFAGLVLGQHSVPTMTESYTDARFPRRALLPRFHRGRGRNQCVQQRDLGSSEILGFGRIHRKRVLPTVPPQDRRDRR